MASVVAVTASELVDALIYTTLRHHAAWALSRHATPSGSWSTAHCSCHWPSEASPPCPADLFAGSTLRRDIPAFGHHGTYTIVVAPDDKVPFTIAESEQTAELPFTAIEGEWLGLGLTDLSMPPQVYNFSVVHPDFTRPFSQATPTSRGTAHALHYSLGRIRFRVSLLCRSGATGWSSTSEPSSTARRDHLW